MPKENNYKLSGSISGEAEQESCPQFTRQFGRSCKVEHSAARPTNLVYTDGGKAGGWNITLKRNSSHMGTIKLFMRDISSDLNTAFEQPHITILFWERRRISPSIEKFQNISDYNV